MEFTNSQRIFILGIFQVVGSLSRLRILTLGIFQILFIPSALRILMSGASKRFGALASRSGHFPFFTQQVISSIKSAGHFLFSIHASGVSIFTNFGLAHNKRQQSDSAKAVTNFAGAKLLPVLPRRCAGRYKSRMENL
ncbi:hypothetical protein [Shewanella algae]|uniref:hypothetical protein n=1 Tax=Shewanella algae TaxID=38313 RepID=UPI0031F4DB56